MKAIFISERGRTKVLIENQKGLISMFDFCKLLAVTDNFWEFYTIDKSSIPLDQLNENFKNNGIITFEHLLKRAEREEM